MNNFWKFNYIILKPSTTFRTNCDAGLFPFLISPAQNCTIFYASYDFQFSFIPSVYQFNSLVRLSYQTFPFIRINATQWRADSSDKWRVQSPSKGTQLRADALIREFRRRSKKKKKLTAYSTLEQPLATKQISCFAIPISLSGPAYCGTINFTSGSRLRYLCCIFHTKRVFFKKANSTV